MKSFDCIFVPHNSYHSREMLVVSRHLKESGLKVGFICIDEHYAHNHRTYEIIAENGFEVLQYHPGILAQVNTKALYVMNDWGGVAHELVKEANKRGLLTFGAVEGVNDFEDCGMKIDGEGRVRNPYKTVKQVFLTGKHDLKFFPDQKCHLVGIPRIDPLISETPLFPRIDEVLINCNFTYGIYSDRRELWITEVVSIVEELGLTYKISQHPSDDGDLRKYTVSKEKFITDLRNTTLLVSRFSGCIIESLALGKPCVYYDSFNEAVPKFKQPLGAYSRARNQVELKAAIEKEISGKSQIENKAKQFLDFHLMVNRFESSSCRIARWSRLRKPGHLKS